VTPADRASGRCHLVYALAPDGMAAREANEALNEYIGERRRGIPVMHDHFTGKPHGGFAVLYVADEQQLALLDDPGPLVGWQIRAHVLVFALTPVGFTAQTEFTLEEYGKTTLARLRAEEAPDPRYWWRK
jgi:hypothetical protein